MENTELFKQITAKMAETYEKKNADYGNSFEETLNKWGTNIALARMDDKLNRVNTLLNKTAQVKDESVEDTLMDLATYAIMTLMFLKKDINTTKIETPSEPIKQLPNFDYLLNKTVIIKGGIDSKGFPTKKIWGTICKIGLNDDNTIRVFYEHVKNSRGQVVGSGLFNSLYPIDNLAEYGLDKNSMQ